MLTALEWLDDIPTSSWIHPMSIRDTYQILCKSSAQKGLKDTHTQSDDTDGPEPTGDSE